MCLLVLGWRVHPHYPLLVAANRDEYHARAAAPLAPWTDAPAIIGGRDLVAGGTWLAVDRRGRAGLVTNFREFGRRRRSAPSRGGLIPAFLAGSLTPAEYVARIETDAPGYAGFNLLLADGKSLWYASNRADVFARELAPGIYGLSNDFLDTPWPKVRRARERLVALLRDPAASTRHTLVAGLFALLADREPAPVEDLPPGDLDPSWARELSAPFVLDETYGTRCSTVLTVTAGGALEIVERRFDARGEPAGESEYALNATGEA